MEKESTIYFRRFKMFFFFTFFGYSGLELEQEKTPHLEGTVPEVTSSEGRPGEADSVSGQKGAGRRNSPDPSSHNLTWSIRQEVERLMQDHKYCSPTSSQAPKANKQPVSQTSKLHFSIPINVTGKWTLGASLIVHSKKPKALKMLQSWHKPNILQN